MKSSLQGIEDVPIYGTVEAARYVRVPYETLRYWTLGSESVPPLIELAAARPPRLSFSNLLECHILSATRGFYRLGVPKVRRALKTVHRLFPSLLHPLIDLDFQTGSVDLFIQQIPDVLIDVSKNGQLALKEVLSIHLQRIERDPHGPSSFFPFVEARSSTEPRIIAMNPAVAFGKPVIAGTGISTGVIATRFHARESLGELAKEYALPEAKLEEAVRWESRDVAA